MKRAIIGQTGYARVGIASTLVGVVQSGYKHPIGTVTLGESVPVQALEICELAEPFGAQRTPPRDVLASCAATQRSSSALDQTTLPAILWEGAPRPARRHASRVRGRTGM